MKIQDEEESEIFFSYTQRNRDKDINNDLLLNKNSKIQITDPYTKCMRQSPLPNRQICCFTYDGGIEHR